MEILQLGAAAPDRSFSQNNGFRVRHGGLTKMPAKKVAVALANKMARIAWKLMVSGQSYDPHRAIAKAMNEAA
jgi:hypothetical protein